MEQKRGLNGRGVHMQRTPPAPPALPAAHVLRKGKLRFLLGSVPSRQLGPVAVSD